MIPAKESPIELFTAAYSAASADRLIANFEMDVAAFDVRPNGEGWVVSDYESVSSYAAGTRDLLWQFELAPTTDFVGSLSVSPDGQRIALGVTDNQLNAEGISIGAIRRPGSCGRPGLWPDERRKTGATSHIGFQLVSLSKRWKSKDFA